jgi:exonuclease III
MRGFKSKKQALSKILVQMKPSLVALNETQLTGRMKVKLDSYTCWTRNRSGQGGGGIATAVSEGFKGSAVGAGEGTGDDEYLVTRIECFAPALNVINCYGEQRKTKKEEIEDKWKRLVKEMEEIRARKEFCLLTGDLNKLVGCDKLGVPGNHSEVSAGGHLLRGLLATGDWTLVNSLGQEVVQGGPFTRRDPATGNLSCLDLFVVSQDLRPYVSSLVIDSQQRFSPARAVRGKEGSRLVYSDHYPVLLTLSGLPRGREVAEERKTVWNFAKEGGWNRYKLLTEEYGDAFEKMVENEESTIDENMKKFDKLHEKIKFRAFGKVTIGGYKKRIEQSEKENVTADEIVDEQIIRTEKEIEDIKKAHTNRVGRVWEVRKKVIGGKLDTIETSAIRNPATKKLVMKKDEIKSVTLNYCKATLRNNTPEDEFKELISKKKDLVKERLNESEGEMEIEYETFERLVNKFKNSGKKNYDFLTKAGDAFQMAVYKFCERMIREEKFPKSFSSTMLHMIFKGGKGKRENLPDNRFIHSKSWFPRTAEGLVVNSGLREPLIEQSSIYQIGGQPGHRVEEFIFVMKSVIAHYRSQNKMVILQCYDLEKYFDKEMVEDAVLTCYERGANPKAIRCWYKLNDNTEIRVRTGAGVSEEANVGAVIGQGTIAGALVSQAVLDDAVQEQFKPGGEEELSYGGVHLAPLLFQDDIIHGAAGLPQAREANRKMNLLVKQRALGLNSRKSVMIVIGSKGQKEEVSKELTKNPLMCGNIETKETEADKWLGQFMSAKGLSDSVQKTVEAREGKIKGACLEIASIVEDWRSQAVGGMETALLLWEACVIPSLLSGAGTWVEMSPATERKLESLQNWFLRLILRVGPGCPVASLRWETGVLSMALRIWVEKVMLVRHLRSLEEETLASKIYQEQKKQKWPGLAKEAALICSELGIENVNTADVFSVSTKDYRKSVIEHCRAKDEKCLREMAEGKEKCTRIMSEEYGKKKYISSEKIYNVRQHFYSRVKMQPFGGNYTKDRRFHKSNWMCKCQQEKEEESHLLSGDCPVYGDIIGGFENMDNDQNLVAFFTQVLARRDQLDREEREEEERAEAAGRTAADSASPMPGHAGVTLLH